MEPRRDWILLKGEKAHEDPLAVWGARRAQGGWWETPAFPQVGDDGAGPDGAEEAWAHFKGMRWVRPGLRGGDCRPVVPGIGKAGPASWRGVCPDLRGLPPGFGPHVG